MISESPFFNLIGKRVIVIWTDDAYREGSDWIAFRVIDSRRYAVELQGVDSPDGSRHEGDIVKVANDDIRDIIEWKERA